jgi:hypothetical protein
VTAAPGVWAAGNVTDPQAQVVTSAAAGLAAGAAINLDLVTEDARRAVSTQPAVSRADGGKMVPYGPAATVAEPTR